MSTKSTDHKGGSFSFLPMDLSGKLIIKARLGDDIRRVPIHNEDITYDELLLMLQRVFRGKLNNTDDVTLKYCDEDGDLITVADSSDLNVAKQISRLLKITIFIHGQEPLPILDASEVQEVRKELVAIRNKVNTLLDAIDGNSKRGKVTEVEPPAPAVPKASSGVVTDTTKPVEHSKPTASITMFDPLKSVPSQGSCSVSSSDSPTSHLFSHASGMSNDFLAPTGSTTKQQSPSSGYAPPSQPSGYPSSSQPSQTPYSASPSPSAPQVQQQPPTQQLPMPTQQPDSSYFMPQQQKAGYPQSQHYQTPPPTASPGPSAPPTSSYQQQTGYSQPGYTAGAPPPQPQQQPPPPQQGSYNYGFQTSQPPSQQVRYGPY